MNATTSHTCHGAVFCGQSKAAAVAACAACSAETVEVNATVEDLTTAAGTDAVFAAFRVTNARRGLMQQFGFVSAEMALQMLERSTDATSLVFRVAS